MCQHRKYSDINAIPLSKANEIGNLLGLDGRFYVEFGYDQIIAKIKELQEKSKMNFYNVRDSKGRFTKNAGNGSVSPTSGFTSVPSAPSNQKEAYLATLRTTEVMVTHEHRGQQLVEVFTLKPDYLTGYVGKGNSSRAPSDLIYAYNVDEKRFKTIDVTKVSAFVPL